MSDDKKKPSNGNGGNGNGSGHRVIQFAAPPQTQQQPQQPAAPPKKIGSAAVIDKLRELLAVAETGRFQYMVFIGIAANGDITLSWSHTNDIKEKVYLLGAIDLAHTTLVSELLQTAKKGIK